MNILFKELILTIQCEVEGVLCSNSIANHQAVRSKIGGDMAEELQRQLLMDQQKNEAGKLKQYDLLKQQEFAKGNCEGLVLVCTNYTYTLIVNIDTYSMHCTNMHTCSLHTHTHVVEPKEQPQSRTDSLWTPLSRLELV